MTHTTTIRAFMIAITVLLGFYSSSYADDGQQPFAHSAAYFGAEAGIRKTKTKGDQQIRLAGASDFQKFDLSRKVAVGGIFIGYKELKKHFMHGLEISANVSQARLKTTLTGKPGGPYAGRSSTISLKRYTIGPASLIFGIPVANRFLPYIRTGACVGYFDVRHTEGLARRRKYKWKLGVLVGGGLETAITHKLSTRLEFKYEKFSRYRTKELGTTPSGISIKQVHDPSSMSLQAGILYHVTPKAAM